MVKITDNSNFKTIFFLIGFIPTFVINFMMTSMYYASAPIYLRKVAAIWIVTVLIAKIVITDRLTIKEFFVYALLVGSAVLSYIKIDNNMVLIMVICILASKGVKPKILIWSYMFVGISMLFFVVYSTKLGIIPDLTYVRDGTIRHALGAIYPTDLAAHVFYFCCGYVFLRDDKFGFGDLLGLVVVALVVYKITDARMNAALIIFLALIVQMKNYIPNKILNIGWLVPGASAIAIFFASVWYTGNSPFLSWLNGALSERLSIVNTIYNQYGLSFLGKKIIQNGLGGDGVNLNQNIYNYTYIDSAYMRLILMFGIVTAILFIIMLSVLIRSQSHNMVIIILVTIALSGIIEQHFIDIAYNPFFIMAVATSVGKLHKTDNNEAY